MGLDLSRQKSVSVALASSLLINRMWRQDMECREALEHDGGALCCKDPQARKVIFRVSGSGFLPNYRENAVSVNIAMW